MSEEEGYVTVVEHRPEIAVYKNKGGSITVRMVYLSDDLSSVREEMMAIPFEYAKEISEAILKVAGNS